jgi:hypothetical protein
LKAKNLSIIITALFCVLFGLQVKSQELTCGKFKLPINSNLDSSQRILFCDFLLKNVITVKVVSLNPYCWKVENKAENCMFETVINNDSIDEKRFKSIALISNVDVSILLNILYKPERNLKIYTSSNCYEPRHGIAFYDEFNNLIAFYEVCFECKEIRKTSNLPGFRFLINEDYIAINKILIKYIKDYNSK